MSCFLYCLVCLPWWRGALVYIVQGILENGFQSAYRMLVDGEVVLIQGGLPGLLLLVVQRICSLPCNKASITLASPKVFTTWGLRLT